MSYSRAIKILAQIYQLSDQDSNANNKKEITDDYLKNRSRFHHTWVQRNPNIGPTEDDEPVNDLDINTDYYTKG